jgi:glycosyltransferase involved in cell wall biosynthesis
MPLAVEQFDMREYDVIVSSSHAVAKGVLTRPDQVHVSYVHTPARYAWNLQAEYLEDDRSCRLKTFVTRIGLHYFRLWDVASANRVDHFVANSHNVAARIAKYYRREAQVIYPPVDIERYRYDRQREEYFLAVGRLVRYKRTDIICKAFSTLNLPLVVIGDGPESGRLRAMSSSNVKFLGWQPDAVLTDYLERCRALVFAADEDFGIVPVEAQAAGAPVIAYRRGGVLESVLPGVTGLLYDKQDAASLCGAIMKLVESGQPSDAGACRCSAERFSVARFCTAFQDFITAVR